MRPPDFTNTSGPELPGLPPVDAADAHEAAPGSPPSDSYLAWARKGRGRGRYYLLGTAIIIILGSVAAGLAFVVAEALVPSWAPGMTATLVSFLPQFAMVLLVVVAVHRRGWRSVITGRRHLAAANFLRPALVWAILMLAVTIPVAILDPDGLRWGPASWPAFASAAVVAIALIPFQASFEELFFRGYLIQWASLATKRRWALASISAVPFALLHMANPELAGLQGAAVLLGPIPYLALGYAFAWVSISTGSIEAAIGAHVVNNIVLATLMGASNSVLESTTLVVDISPNYLLSVLSTVVACVMFVRIIERQHQQDRSGRLATAKAET
jgi:hypothetical protein